MSCVLASTNLSKLRDVIIISGSEPQTIENGGWVTYAGVRRLIISAKINRLRNIAEIALG